MLGDKSATLSIDIFFATSGCCDLSLLLTGVVDALELVTLTLESYFTILDFLLIYAGTGA